MFKCLSIPMALLFLLPGCANHPRNRDHQHRHDHRHGHAHRHGEVEPASDFPRVESVTPHSPETVTLAPGVFIIDDITDPDRVPGVETLEGRFGPLILTSKSQTYYVRMVPGFFIHAHPHGARMIIYTVHGRWVLASKGNRYVMKPGSLFHFEPGKPTGYEVPFDEPATILIFQETEGEGDPHEFMRGLESLKARMEERHDGGMPVFFHELPTDHPARVFARTVNPDWAAKLDATTESTR